MGSGGSQKIFVTVKSYSKRGQLLKRPDLQTLAESRDLDELVTRIKNTKYIDAVNSVSKPYTAEKLEMALKTYSITIQKLPITQRTSIPYILVQVM